MPNSFGAYPVIASNLTNNNTVCAAELIQVELLQLKATTATCIKLDTKWLTILVQWFF